MTKELLNRIAHHEAGHAVIAHYIGVKVDEISIIPEKEQDAYLKLNDEIPVEPEKQAMIAWAGPATDEIYCRKEIKDDKNAKDRFIFDGKTHEAYFYRSDPPLRGAERTQKREALKQQVNRLLKENWPVVEALASALLKKEKLTGNEVIQIIESRSSNE